MRHAIPPDPPGTVYELWTQPTEGGRWSYGGVRGTHRECVLSEFPPRSNIWIRRFIPVEAQPVIRCSICEVTIDKCTCPDADERLRGIRGKEVAMKWCRTCDRHYGRCKCPPPYAFYVRVDGKDATHLFPQVDLTQR